MINDYYINDYEIYIKSGSTTSDGTDVTTGSLSLTGKCRIDPIQDNEGASTHKIFLDVVDLSHTDTIYVDGDPYEIKGINKFYNSVIGHHLELDVFVI